MNWLKELFTNQESVAHIVLLYSLVISLGVYLGKIKIGGISLGVTFILFVGILAGHLGLTYQRPEKPAYDGRNYVWSRNKYSWSWCG